MAEFSFTGYLVTKAITERHGLPPARVNQLGLVGALMGLTPMWIILADRIALREAPAPTTTGANGHK